MVIKYGDSCSNVGCLGKAHVGGLQTVGDARLMHLPRGLVKSTQSPIL
jgi:hypothetical protein